MITRIQRSILDFFLTNSGPNYAGCAITLIVLAVSLVTALVFGVTVYRIFIPVPADPILVEANYSPPAPTPDSPPYYRGVYDTCVYFIAYSEDQRGTEVTQELLDNIYLACNSFVGSTVESDWEGQVSKGYGP